MRYYMTHKFYIHMAYENVEIFVNSLEKRRIKIE